jgi:hypothetical protein
VAKNVNDPENQIEVDKCGTDYGGVYADMLPINTLIARTSDGRRIWLRRSSASRA